MEEITERPKLVKTDTDSSSNEFSKSASGSESGAPKKIYKSQRVNKIEPITIEGNVADKSPVDKNTSSKKENSPNITLRRLERLVKYSTYFFSAVSILMMLYAHVVFPIIWSNKLKIHENEILKGIEELKEVNNQIEFDFHKLAYEKFGIQIKPEHYNEIKALREAYKKDAFHLNQLAHSKLDKKDAAEYFNELEELRGAYRKFQSAFWESIKRNTNLGYERVDLMKRVDEYELLSENFDKLKTNYDQLLQEKSELNVDEQLKELSVRKEFVEKYSMHIRLAIFTVVFTIFAVVLKLRKYKLEHADLMKKHTEMTMVYDALLQAYTNYCKMLNYQINLHYLKN